MSIKLSPSTIPESPLSIGLSIGGGEDRPGRDGRMQIEDDTNKDRQLIGKVVRRRYTAPAEFS